MTKEGSHKIVNFITIGFCGLMIGRGYMSHYNEYPLSCTLLIDITLIAIVLGDFPIPFIFIYFKMCQLICKYEPKYESRILR